MPPASPTTRRRALRRQATPAEQVLWRGLRDRRLAGWKFRRQAQVGPYVVDFVCAQARLVIEVDGSVHQDPARHASDTVRQQDLERVGYRVVRFTNEEVLRDLDVVMDAVAMALDTSSPQAPTTRRTGSPHPSPLPSGERGTFKSESSAIPSSKA